MEQSVRLSMKFNGIVPTVHAVQYETGRVLKMIIQDAELASGSTATLMFTRSDGTYDTADCTLVLADNAFTADITQALTQRGPTACQLKVTSSNKIVSTFLFIIDVQKTTEGRVLMDQHGYTVEEMQAYINAFVNAASALYRPVEYPLADEDRLQISIHTTNKWKVFGDTSSSLSSVFEIPEGALSVTVNNDSGSSTIIAFLNSFSTPVTDGGTPDFSVSYSSRISLDNGDENSYAIVDGMNYLYVLRQNTSGNDVTPSVTFSFYTDDTLSIPGMPAESKKVGDELAIRPYVTSFDGGTVLGAQTLNTICRVSSVTVSDAPDDVSLTSYAAWLWTYGITTKHQVLFYPHNGAIYQRYYRQSGGSWSWTAWASTLDSTLSVSSFDGGTLLGNQTVNTFCRLYAESNITDLPTGVVVSNHIGWLYTVGSSSNRHQLLFVPYYSNVYQRLYREGSWGDWSGMLDAALDSTIKIASYDGGTLLGNQTKNTFCRISIVSGITDMPEGVDLGTYTGWLLTAATAASDNKFQVLFFPHNSNIYQRLYRRGEWTSWVSVRGHSGSADDTEESIKVLCVGNSFNQAVFSYVPPILQEILPNCNITMGLLYIGGGGYEHHLRAYRDDTPYTMWNLWEPDSTSWTRESNSMTLVDALAYDHWDIIITQDTSPHAVSSTNVNKYWIGEGRKLLRVIQDNLSYPAQMYTIAFVGRPTDGYTSAQMTEYIMEHTELVMEKLGFLDYIPVASAIGSARTNPTFADMGSGGDMLYNDDGGPKHLQNGIPLLLAAYTVTLKLLEWMGHKDKGVYGSSFVPDAATLTAINAVDGGMTHGAPDGLDEDGLNILAAQEIATLAVRNPTEIIDCTNIIVTDVGPVDDENT